MSHPASTREDGGPVERAYRHLLTRLSHATDGCRLPSERALASELGISRQSVRMAFRRLRNAGYVSRVVGSGSFAILPSAGASTGLPDVGMLDVLEARHILEPVIAALATSRATGEDFVRLRQRLQALRQATEPRDYKEAGYRFWQEVARATRNPLVAAMYQMLIECRAQLGWDHLSGLITDAGRHAVQGRLAEEICQAMQARDRERARSLAAERTRNMLLAMADLESDVTDARWSSLDV